MMNRPMRPIYRGEAYWIAPEKTIGSEQSSIRERPGIIVSNDMENRTSDHVLAVFTTTQKKTKIPTHTSVMMQQKSIALCEQVKLVPKRYIKNYIGQCDQEEILRINKALGLSLNIGVRSKKELYPQQCQRNKNPFSRGRLCSIQDKYDPKEHWPGIIVSNNIGNIESPILEIARFHEGEASSPLHITFKTIPEWYLDLGYIDTIDKSRATPQQKYIPWKNLQKTGNAMELSLGLKPTDEIVAAYNRIRNKGGRNHVVSH